MRSRSGWVIGLVFGVVLLLCIGGGFGAFVLVSQVEGRGASTPTVAADTVMRGIFVDRDPDAVKRYMCSSIDQVTIDQKINEVNSLLGKHSEASFSWEKSEKSRSRTEVVFKVRLDLRDSEQTFSSQNYELTTESNGGWRVCGLKRVPA